MSMKIQLATSLFIKTKILLLDEPTNHLAFIILNG